MLEEWRSVKGFENKYEVSSFGRVRGKSILKSQLASGYLQVYFWVVDKQKWFKVHYLVAEAFPEICGQRFPGAQIDHINGNRQDNRPENLRWVTPKENTNNPNTIEKLRSIMAEKSKQYWEEKGIDRETALKQKRHSYYLKNREKIIERAKLWYHTHKNANV